MEEERRQTSVQLDYVYYVWTVYDGPEESLTAVRH